MDIISGSSVNYKLLDSGLEQKLEMISNSVIIRPTPISIWNKHFTKKWNQVDGICVRRKDGGSAWSKDADLGKFYFKHVINNKDYKFLLEFTKFGHCGIFFEQMAVWRKMSDLVEKCKKYSKRPRVLNLFAYTGAASVVMAASGAEVTHVDSSKGIIEWAKENEKLNTKLSLEKINWVQEDVLAFLKKCKRNNDKFDGILLDPPSWGSGIKKGEKWVFEKNVRSLIEYVCDVLEVENSFVMMTTHTPGVQKEAIKNILCEKLYRHEHVCGDVGIKHSDDDRILPAGIYNLATYFE